MHLFQERIRFLASLHPRVIDIGEDVLRIAFDEEPRRARSMGDDHAEAIAFAGAGSCTPLLEESTTKICIDQAAFHFSHGTAEITVCACPACASTFESLGPDRRREPCRPPRIFVDEKSARSCMPSRRPEVGPPMGGKLLPVETSACLCRCGIDAAQRRSLTRSEWLSCAPDQDVPLPAPGHIRALRGSMLIWSTRPCAIPFHIPTPRSFPHRRAASLAICPATARRAMPRSAIRRSIASSRLHRRPGKTSAPMQSLAPRHAPIHVGEPRSPSSRPGARPAIAK